MIQTGSNSSVDALVSLGASRAREARMPSEISDQRSFQATLARAGADLSAREAAEELVSSALVQPVLARLREQNNAAPPFAPTQAEKTFGGLLDAEFAKRIVRANDFDLVDAVERVMGKVKKPPAGEGA